MRSGRWEHKAMLGYDAVARVLDSGQAVLERTIHDPEGSIFLVAWTTALLALLLSFMWEWLEPVFLGKYPDALHPGRPPGWLRVAYRWVGAFGLWYFIICIPLWMYLRGAVWLTINFVVLSVGGAFLVPLILRFWRRSVGHRRNAILTALGVFGFVAVALWINPRGSDLVMGTFSVATILAMAGAAYWLLREFRRPRVLDEPSRYQSRSGHAWPPIGPPEVTTHGDAQLADPSIHGRGMRDILGGGKGIWFGQIVGSGREAAYVGDRHLLTVAPNRTGKGSCTIIPNILMDVEHSIICIDPKGQNAAVTARTRRGGGRPVYCLNPFGEHTG